MSKPTDALAEYILPSKYSRKVEGTDRLETYQEVVDRVQDMHLRRFPTLAKDIEWAFERVHNKQALPSMRAMQFAGKAVESKHARQYNCSASPVDRIRVFSEALWLSLCGTGVGFSVQRCHVDNLPAIAANWNNSHSHIIEDTIEGWAEALNDLLESAVRGEWVEFDYSKIRPRGAPLVTSGGKAPGPDGLRASLIAVDNILYGARGRKLRPIECHDIMCLSVDAVLSGGIRRSALISLFDYDDEEMMSAKTGNWRETHPWRENANNSAMMIRNEVTFEQFSNIYEKIKEWGEPGFLFSDSRDHLTNPCVEAGLYPFLHVTEADKTWLALRGIHANVGDKLSGWQMCNLTEVNVAACPDAETFFNACKASAIIGTLQASYTDLDYLGPVSRRIVERDALIGVGLTGVLDNPKIGLNEPLLREAASIVAGTNREYANKLNINPSPRTTLVKPSGTSALVLEVSSGIHAHHAGRYIRRVTASDTEDTFKAFKAANPGWCVKKPNGNYAIEFPVKAPPGAMLLEDLTATGFLTLVLDMQRAWVVPGQLPVDPLHPSHNVSNTIAVREDEWEDLKKAIWENRKDIRGIALLPFIGDKIYPFAPREAITTQEDEDRWEYLLNNYIPVNYAIIDGEGFSVTSLEPACAGGACQYL